MARSLRHLARGCLCLLALSLAAGCSSASERIAGWYVTRKLDGYFDFTSEQKREVRVLVDDTLLMLRRTELPRWLSLLREIRQGIHDGLDEPRLSRLQQRYDERLDALVALLSPRAAPVLARLDAGQLDHFAERARKELDDEYEDLDQPPKKQARRLEERALDRLEDFVGDLSDAQEEQVRGLIRALPSERAAQYRSARENIARFRAFMATRPEPAAIEAELRAMWEGRYDGLGRGHGKSERRAVQRGWLLSVYRLLTGEQRAHAEEELSDRIRSLKRWELPN